MPLMVIITKCLLTYP